MLSTKTTCLLLTVETVDLTTGLRKRNSKPRSQNPPASQIPLHATMQRTSEVEHFPAEGKFIHTKAQQQEILEGSGFCTLLCCSSKSQLKGILWPLCHVICPMLKKYDKQYERLYYCACMYVQYVVYTSNVIRVEWQSVWSVVMKQLPYCPDPARGDLSFTVLKVQLGTSILLTTTGFHCSFPALFGFVGYVSCHHISLDILFCCIWSIKWIASCC